MLRTAIAACTAAALVVSGLAADAAVSPAPASEPPGRIWFVAISGDDDGAGTRDDPFATWQRGIDAARPGDRVVIGPGTYRVSGFRYAGVTIDRSGTRAAPISLAGDDPADRPVLDCSGLDNDGGLACLSVEADWWHLSGIEVTGTPQPTPETPTALRIQDASHNQLRYVASHHNRGTGIAISGRSRHNLLRDCDAYRNQDPGTVDMPYGNSDGIDVSFLRPRAVGNRVVGCRTWWNSDDGIDLWESEAPVTIRRSWSFRNGYIPGSREEGGNGQGFKLGRNDTGPRHVITRCLAFDNRSFGFDSNDSAGGLQVRHNTAYRNHGGNFAMYGDRPHELRNNVAVPERITISDPVDDSYNSWTLAVEATRADFRSVDWSRADDPRAPDGSLPRLPFLRLRPGSDLVDAGVDVGHPYEGDAPDLGAYEQRVAH